MKKQKEKHILTNQQGFTLAELLVVVAIIGILVAISVPVFAAQLERSREATDMANVRVAYAEVLTAVNSGDVNESRIVPLKQKEDVWQTPRKVMIGGITENDTNNWIGNPTAKGSCKVYYDPAIGPVLQWSREFSNIHNPFNNSGVLDYIHKTYGSNVNLEIDSGCTSSKMVKLIQPFIDEDKNRSSLMKTGTWAYMGSVSDTGSDHKNQDRYWFWTSVDINKNGFQAGETVPMIVSTADGKFYISNSQTTTRTSNGMTYNVIIKSTSLAGSKKQQIEAYKKYIPSDPTDCFDNLNDAYAAYEKLVKSNPDYQKYENTLPY